MGLYGLSILTKRQFLIDMTQPCNFTHLFVPNEINWLPNQYDLSGLKTTRLDCMLSNEKKHFCQYHLRNLHKNNEALATDVLIVNTNHDWLKFFSRKKSIQKKILSLGIFNSTNEFMMQPLFYSWYAKLFKLAAPLQRKYDLIKENAQINNLTQLFCAQIRIGGARPGVNDDKQFNYPNVTKLFWNFIRSNFTQNMSNISDWKIFVTSDSEWVEREALAEFGKEKLIRISGVNSHIDYEKNLGNNCSRVEKPILDFHFMQNCDKALISRSGFGRFALWNRINPTKDLYAVVNGTIVDII